MKNQHLTLMQRVFVEIDQNESWYLLDADLMASFGRALAREMKINDTFQGDDGVVYQLRLIDVERSLYRVARTRRIDWGEAQGELSMAEARKLGYVVEGS